MGVAPGVQITNEVEGIIAPNGPQAQRPCLSFIVHSSSFKNSFLLRIHHRNRDHVHNFAGGTA